GQAGASIGAGTGGREHVQALDNQDVGAADHHFLVRQDVVGQVGVHGCADLFGTALNGADEAEQGPAVVGFREAFAAHEAAALQLGVGVEEAIGGDQFHVRSVRPAAQHLLEHARGCGFAHSHGAGNANHEGGAGAALTQKSGGGAVQVAGGANVKIEEAG